MTWCEPYRKIIGYLSRDVSLKAISFRPDISITRHSDEIVSISTSDWQKEQIWRTMPIQITLWSQSIELLSLRMNLVN